MLKNVLVMGTEASDLVLYVLPCVLRIKVVTILIDRTAGVSSAYSRTESVSILTTTTCSTGGSVSRFKMVSLLRRKK